MIDASTGFPDFTAQQLCQKRVSMRPVPDSLDGVIVPSQTLDLFRHYSAPFHDEASMEGMLQEIAGWLGKTGFEEITVRGPVVPCAS